MTSTSKFRRALEKLGAVLAALALLAFVVGAVFWFVASAKSNGTIAAGDAFVGLGYMAAALVVALLAVLGWRMLGLVRAAEPVKRQQRPRRPDDEHSIIRTQLAWGSALVIVGAIVGLICLCFIHPSAAIAGPVLALATAVIAAGAVLLPAGAASSAGARLQQQGQVEAVPDVNAPAVTRTADGTGASLSGVVAPKRIDVEAYFEFQDMPDPSGAAPPAPTARVQPTEHIPGSVSAKTVQGQLTNLDPEKAYRVRLAARGPTGRSVESEWATVEKYAPEEPAADGNDDGDEDGATEPPAPDDAATTEDRKTGDPAPPADEEPAPTEDGTSESAGTTPQTTAGPGPAGAEGDDGVATASPDTAPLDTEAPDDDTQEPVSDDEELTDETPEPDSRTTPDEPPAP